MPKHAPEKEQLNKVQYVKRRELPVSDEHAETEEAVGEQISDGALAETHLNPVVEVAWHRRQCRSLERREF